MQSIPNYTSILHLNFFFSNYSNTNYTTWTTQIQSNYEYGNKNKWQMQETRERAENWQHSAKVNTTTLSSVVQILVHTNAYTYMCTGSVITHAGGSRGVGWVISCVCDCVSVGMSVHALSLNGKRLELSAPKSVASGRPKVLGYEVVWLQSWNY